MTDLTDVDGIGDARAETMAENGYESLEDLSNADPEQLEEDINRLTADRATSMVLQAENMLEEGGDGSGNDGEEEEVVTTDDVTGPLDENVSDDADDVSTDEGGDTTSSDEPDTESSDDEQDDSESGPTLHELHVEVEDVDDGVVRDEFVAAMVEYRRNYRNRNPTRARMANEILDKHRRNDGQLYFELDRDELNVMHSAMKKRKNDYRGSNEVDEMNILRSIIESVNEVRL